MAWFLIDGVAGLSVWGIVERAILDEYPASLYPRLVGAKGKQSRNKPLLYRSRGLVFLFRQDLNSEAWSKNHHMKVPYAGFINNFSNGGMNATLP